MPLHLIFTKRQRDAIPVYLLLRRRRRRRLLLGSRNINENMSQRASLWAPTATFDLVVLVAVDDLKLVARPLGPIVPVKLANLLLAIEQVHPSFAPSPSAGADLADALGGDDQLVDIVLGQGFLLILRTMELTSKKQGETRP